MGPQCKWRSKALSGPGSTRFFNFWFNSNLHEALSCSRQELWFVFSYDLSCYRNPCERHGLTIRIKISLATTEIYYTISLPHVVEDCSIVRVPPLRIAAPLSPVATTQCQTNVCTAASACRNSDFTLTIRYNRREFNVDSKAEYSALSSTRSQKNIYIRAISFRYTRLSKQMMPILEHFCRCFYAFFLFSAR